MNYFFFVYDKGWMFGNFFYVKEIIIDSIVSFRSFFVKVRK